MGTWENKVQIHMDQDFCPALQAHLKVLTLTVLDGQFPLEQFMSQHPHPVRRLFTSPGSTTEWGFFSSPYGCWQKPVTAVKCFVPTVPLQTQWLRPLRSVALNIYQLHHLVQKKVKASREEVHGTCSLLSLSHSHRPRHSGKGLGHTGLAGKAAALGRAPYPGLLSSAFQE